MPIQLNCPQCKTAYRLGDDLRGKQIRCQKCNQVFLAGRAVAPAPAALLPPPPAKARPPAARPAPVAVRKKAATAPKPQKSAPAKVSRASAPPEAPGRSRRWLLGVAAVPAFLLLLVCGGGLGIVGMMAYLGQTPTHLFAAAPTTDLRPMGTKPVEAPPPKQDKTETPAKDNSQPSNKDKSEPLNKDKSEPPNEDKTELPGKDKSEPPNKDKSEPPNKDKTEPPPNKDKTEPPPVDPPKPGDRITKENFDKIDKGMTREALSELLGPASETHTSGKDWSQVWKTRGGPRITVKLSNGVVVAKYNDQSWEVVYGKDGPANPVNPVKPPDNPDKLAEILTKANFDKIDKGMGKDALIALLGQPTATEKSLMRSVDAHWIWKAGEKGPQFTVDMLRDQVVAKASNQAWPVVYAKDNNPNPVKPVVRVTQENFDKIEKGMTLDALKDLLGPPTDTKEVKIGDVDASLTWMDENRFAIFVMLSQGKVHSKSNLQGWAVVYPKEANQNATTNKPATTLTKENFDKIDKEMTREALLKLLGTPNETQKLAPTVQSVVDFRWTWKAEDKTVVMVDLFQGTVVSKWTTQQWPVVYAKDLANKPKVLETVSREDFDKIDRDMTLDDLKKLFGPPSLTAKPLQPGSDSTQIWLAQDKTQITVGMLNGKVVQKANIMGWPVSYPKEAAKRTNVNKDNIDKIDLDQALDALKDVFGPPVGGKRIVGPDGDFQTTWSGPDEVTIVVTTLQGKVVQKANTKGWPVDYPKDVALRKDRQQPWQTITAKAPAIACTSISADGKSLATASTEGGIQVWELATGKERKSWDGPEALVHMIALNPDGKIVVTDAKDKKGDLRAWFTTTDKLQSAFGFKTNPLVLAYRSDGKVAVGQLLMGVKGSQGYGLAPFEPSSKQGFPWTQVGGVKEDEAVRCVACAPDAKSAAIGYPNKSIKIWDTVLGNEIIALEGHNAPITALAYNLDGKTLVSASEDKTVRVWDMTTHKEKAVYKGHTTIPTCVAVTQDGKKVASGETSAKGDKATLKVWDAATGNELTSIEAHDGKIIGVFFSLDGKTMYTVGDKTVKSWDVDYLPGLKASK